MSKTSNTDVMLDEVLVVGGVVSVVVIVVIEGVKAGADIFLHWSSSLNQCGGGKSGGPFWRNDIISRLSVSGINLAW